MKKRLFPLMLCFFVMGFVDLVGIASNYVKEDLNLTDSVANIFPSLVFFWFIIQYFRGFICRITFRCLFGFYFRFNR